MSDSESGARQLSYQPPYVRQEPFNVAVQHTIGREIDLLDEAVDSARLMAFPGEDIEGQHLPLWEGLFQLSPVGKTTEQRIASVVAFLRQMRTTGSGLSWERGLSDYLGTLDSQWSYAEDHPDDRRGIFIDRFNGVTLDPMWQFHAGTLAMSDGLGYCHTLSIAQVVAYRGSDYFDQSHCVKVRKGTADASEAVAVLCKVQDSDSWIELGVYADKLRIITNEDGTKLTRELEDPGVAVLPVGEDRWIRGMIIGNDATVEVWDRDPFLMSGAPLHTATYTFAGGDVTAFGAAAKGKAGLRVVAPMDWQVQDYRAEEVATAPGDYTVRLVTTYSPGSYGALEVAKLARIRTPANLALSSTFSDGFILGVSQLGLDDL